MANTLKVIEPFFVMEKGDTFERMENGMYRGEYNEHLTLAHPLFDSSNDFSATYKSTFDISEDYAKALIDLGHLVEVGKDDKFVNVFDEIENLAKQYDTELDNLDKDYEDQPACLKLEKETVLRNMLKVLEHLHSLKK